jgi:dienelactone hydrolase
MLHERELDGRLQGLRIEPSEPRGIGVVIMGGSSGTVPIERGRLFAQEGLSVIALRWFGGPGQSPGICEIPLEIVESAVSRLVAEGCTRIVLVGTSKGAEAILLAASLDPRVDLAVAFSPTSVVWANVGPGTDGYEWPLRSSFTWRGIPFAFMPHAAEALLSVGRLPPVKYLPLFERSLSDFAGQTVSAAIPVERSQAAFILVAGGDDQLWPSARFAEALAARLRAHGKKVQFLMHPSAGHRILLPGETTARSTLNAHGGTDEADAELGAKAWAALMQALGPVF